ncbi:recombinase family protein [Streptomyces sp. PvR034]|uniref:recombinase family protein n=1 Tax=Streptomyces sp. PvR034 TaxID=3156401 RepID=UPI003395EDFB
MANLVHKRVWTDQRSTARQNLVLDEVGIEDPVVFEEDPGTSSRLHPLQRPKFRELLTYARPDDTVHISEMFRLVRGTGHVLDVLHRDQVALRIHDGASSTTDLTARHPRTGEVLSTVKFTVQTLAAAGELQRDLRRELTYDGLRAAEAKGSKGGRRPAVAAAKTDDVRTAYLEGRSIAALAREHRVSRGAIRTAVADLLPDHTAREEDAPAPELPVTLDTPGKVADYLRTTEPEPAERAALDQGTTVRRGEDGDEQARTGEVSVAHAPRRSRSRAARVKRRYPGGGTEQPVWVRALRAGQYRSAPVSARPGPSRAPGRDRAGRAAGGPRPGRRPAWPRWRSRWP